MALVLADRVRETTSTVGTGTVVLDGATTGYQSFSVVGNGNTTYYCIAGQGTAEWEVGVGTYTASGTTLARTTVLASSNNNNLVNFSAGTKDVFVTYPSEKSVNLDASGLLSAPAGLGAGIPTFLATPTSANLAAAVTDETGSGSLVFATSPTLVTPNLDTPSAVNLANATNLPLATGVSGTLAVGNGGTGLSSLATGRVPYGNGTGAYNNSTGLTYSGTVFKVGTSPELGGTTNPLTAFSSSANGYIQTYIYNVLGGTSSSADFVAYPDNGADAHGWVDMGITSSIYADATYTVTGPNESYLFGSAPTGSGATGNLVFATDNTGTENSHQWYVGGFTQAKGAWKMQLTSSALQLAQNITFTGASARITGDFSNATISDRTALQSSTTNGSTGVYALPNGTATSASFEATNAADPTNASKIQLTTNGATDVQLVSGRNGSGTYLPLSFYTNGSQRMRLDTSGNLGIGNTPSGTYKLEVSGDTSATNAYASTSVIVGTTTSPNGYAVRVNSSATKNIELTNSELNATTKTGVIACSRYTNTDTPFTVIHTQSTSTNNLINIGGGSATNTPASNIVFRTSSNITTPGTGTERFRITSSGAFGLSGSNFGNAGQVLTSLGSFFAPEWRDVGLTLIGTLTTTSGTTQTLSPIDLTLYKFLFCWVSGVSFTTTGTLTLNGVAVTGALSSTANGNIGGIQVDLTTGTFMANIDDLSTAALVSGASTPYSGRNGITTASTSITFAGGTFDAGAIYVYGMN